MYDFFMRTYNTYLYTYIYSTRISRVNYGSWIGMYVCMSGVHISVKFGVWADGWVGWRKILHTFAELHSRPRRCSTASVPRSWQIRSLLAVLLAFLQNLLRISSHFPSNCKLHTLTETDATQLPKIVHATSTSSSSSFAFFLSVCVCFLALLLHQLRPADCFCCTTPIYCTRTDTDAWGTLRCRFDW